MQHSIINKSLTTKTKPLTLNDIEDVVDSLWNKEVDPVEWRPRLSKFSPTRIFLVPSKDIARKGFEREDRKPYQVTVTKSKTGVYTVLTYWFCPGCKSKQFRRNSPPAKGSKEFCCSDKCLVFINLKELHGNSKNKSAKV